VEYDLAAAGITEFDELVQTGFGLGEVPPSPELFVGDTEMTLARWPNDDFVRIGEVIDEGPDTQPRDAADPNKVTSPNEGLVEWEEAGKPRPLPDYFDDGVTFEYGDERPESWENPGDVWMWGYWYFDWASGTLEIASIGEEKNTITTEQASWYNARKGQRYYYFNVLEELDTPGEFYIDREAGTLYLYPPGDLSDVTVDLSLLAEPLVRMEASNVHFDGITFETSRTAGIEMEGTAHNRVRNCTFRRLGAKAVDIAGGKETVDNGVLNCNIADTGKGGVDIDGGHRPSLTPGGNFVVGCDIRRFSRVNATYSPAIGFGGVGNFGAHNEIHDAPHTAILGGGNECVFEYNEIHHVAQETSDVGAFYMGRDFTQQGNVVRYNYFHHVKNDVGGHGQMGVYLDDQASGTVIFGNAFYKVDSPLLIGGGRSNHVHNNLVYDSAKGTGQNWLSIGARGLEWAAGNCMGVMTQRLEAMPYQEPPWSEEYPQLVDIEDDEKCAPKYNVITGNAASKSGPASVGIPVRTRENTVENNLFTEDAIVEVEGESEMSIPDDSLIHEELPHFEPIPFEKIGPAGARDPPSPLAPVEVQATRNDDGSVAVSWDHDYPSDGYAVSRATGDGEFTVIAEGVSEEFYRDESAETDVALRYAVTTVRDGTESYRSDLGFVDLPSTTTGTSTATTETTEDEQTETPEATTSATTEDRASTSPGLPGFGVLTAVGGAGLAGWRLLRGRSDDE